MPSPCELHLTLDAAHGEVVRSFVREAALAEAVPAAIASRVADDSATAWRGLSGLSAGDERVSVALSIPHHEVKVRFLLPGHARFAGAFALLGNLLPQGAGLLWRESGVDGWEVSLHGSLTSRSARMRRRSRAASLRSMATTMFIRTCSRRGATGRGWKAAS